MLQVRVTLQVRGVRVSQTGCARGVFSKLWLRARDRSVKYSYSYGSGMRVEMT